MHLTLSDLAERWRCHRDTAREYTRLPGFPPVLALSRKTLLWDASEVAAWETRKRATPKRRAVPAYRGGALPMPAQVA